MCRVLVIWLVLLCGKVADGSAGEVEAINWNKTSAQHKFSRPFCQIRIASTPDARLPADRDLPAIIKNLWNDKGNADITR